MDVISDHSKAAAEQSPEPQFEHRIRWGNVALAVAGLVAIVAAIGLPHGGTAQSVQQPLAPVTELVTESAPTPRTAAAVRPRRHRARKKRATHGSRKRRRQRPAPPERSVPATPTPTTTPAPASPAPDQTPAAEREFGL